LSQNCIIKEVAGLKKRKGLRDWMSRNRVIRRYAHMHIPEKKSFRFFSHKYIKITATNVIIYGLLDLAVTERGGGEFTLCGHGRDVKSVKNNR
jgi:hypothetical protein